MVFNIGGGAKGAIYTGILPEGLDIYLDDPNNQLPQLFLEL